MNKINYYTEEGLLKLKEELDQLIRVERPAISVQIAEARDKGDISENAEYAAAKEWQGMVEMKISRLQELLQHARIIDESKLDSSKVLVLSKVTIKNLKNNKTMSYILVPEQESDLKSGKISVTSPIAQGLMGKKVGDVVEIKVPAGVIAFEIIDIKR
jgi:transcription elongation factor GreA